MSQNSQLFSNIDSISTTSENQNYTKMFLILEISIAIISIILLVLYLLLPVIIYLFPHFLSKFIYLNFGM